MAGNPGAARLWGDADVYVSFDLEAAVPATIEAPFSAEWDLVGLLDGDTGFTESREEETADQFAWGGILMRTSRRNFKLTRSFMAYESNETTFRLRYPGSTATSIVAPSGNRIERVKIAFETRDQDITERFISAYQAEVVPDGDVVQGESEISAITFIATIYPDADGELFVRQTSEVASA